ncbi:synapse-associated protein 47kD [Halictus rubicundus]|uniref:synapse-associated protein 47kD n=1 Tax=Halictus rubicundus TaxID=77578 RepID=UPI004035ABA4
MFTGLTNQVSTWMGKKAEDGSAEVPTEKKVASPVAEGEVLEDRKDSPTKGGSSKLEMLAGVKTQMTGWLSGGIAGLSRGGAQTTEGELVAGTNEAQAAPNNQPPAEEIKDDDASSATGGADSGPGSLKETPTDDKNGQQPFGAVSTKALEGAKSLGGFLYSAVNKAGKSVVEAGVKIKKTVEENVSNIFFSFASLLLFNRVIRRDVFASNRHLLRCPRKYVLQPFRFQNQ